METSKAPLFGREARMQWWSARRGVWYTEGAPSYLWQGKDEALPFVGWRRFKL